MIRLRVEGVWMAIAQVYAMMNDKDEMTKDAFLWGVTRR